MWKLIFVGGELRGNEQKLCNRPYAHFMAIFPEILTTSDLEKFVFQIFCQRIIFRKLWWVSTPNIQNPDTRAIVRRHEERYVLRFRFQFSFTVWLYQHWYTMIWNHLSFDISYFSMCQIVSYRMSFTIWHMCQIVSCMMLFTIWHMCQMVSCRMPFTIWHMCQMISYHTSNAKCQVTNCMCQIAHHIDDTICHLTHVSNGIL